MLRDGDRHQSLGCGTGTPSRVGVSVCDIATGISAGPANEAGQMLTFHVSNTNNALFSAQPALDPTTGDLTFTAAADANGSATGNFVRTFRLDLTPPTVLSVAPTGAVAKITGHEGLHFEGTARCFHGEEAAATATGCWP